uniref:Uncharacterized protein n=1 Tax=Branchiostoma floridae TaxID=7739 RepID=C3YF10_BRAFL|eukprot:XP_002605244.1 hypothetical protein BRAFLDRAFT_92282 [Branchiostoma floridae]
MLMSKQEAPVRDTRRSRWLVSMEGGNPAGKICLGRRTTSVLGGSDLRHPAERAWRSVQPTPLSFEGCNRSDALPLQQQGCEGHTTTQLRDTPSSTSPDVRPDRTRWWPAQALAAERGQDAPENLEPEEAASGRTVLQGTAVRGSGSTGAPVPDTAQPLPVSSANPADSSRNGLLEAIINPSWSMLDAQAQVPQMASRGAERLASPLPVLELIKRVIHQGVMTSECHKVNICGQKEVKAGFPPYCPN